jgi:hypothetical protein
MLQHFVSFFVSYVKNATGVIGNKKAENLINKDFQLCAAFAKASVDNVARTRFELVTSGLL